MSLNPAGARSRFNLFRIVGLRAFNPVARKRQTRPDYMIGAGYPEEDGTSRNDQITRTNDLKAVQIWVKSGSETRWVGVRSPTPIN